MASSRSTVALQHEKQSRDVVEKQIITQSILTDRDVEQLYLGKLKLTKVASLYRFTNLRIVWLNGNSLGSVECLLNNERLSELYLHDNSISKFNGGIKHLTGLRILTLQRNQLVKLEALVCELTKMLSLERLNLAKNPVSQETDYRHYVIYHIPSLETLDRQNITEDERYKAREIYDQDQELVRRRIAFGSRIEGPPIQGVGLGVDCRYMKHSDPEFGNNFFRQNPPFDTTEEAVEARRLKKSLMEITRLNWEKIPRSEERRLATSEMTRAEATGKGSSSDVLGLFMNPELITLRIKT